MSSKRAVKAPTKKKSAPAKKAVSKVVKKTKEKAPSTKRASKKSTVKKVAVKKVAKKVVPEKSSAPMSKALNPSLLEKEVLSTPAKKVRPLHDSHFDPGIDEGIDPGALPLDEVHDEAEIAQHLQLQEQAAISRKAREMNRPEFHPDFDGETCVECGEDIPPERLRLRRVRCVDCQSFLEEEAARRRRLQG